MAQIVRVSDQGGDGKVKYNDTSGKYGLPKIVGDLGNFWTDLTMTTPRMARSVVDWISGAEPAKKEDPLSILSQNKVRDGRGGGSRSYTPAPAPDDPPEQVRDLDYYLSRAGQYAGGGANYQPVMDLVSKRGKEGDAELEAIYNRLRDAYQGSTGTIGDSYDASLDQINQSYDKGAENIQAARDYALRTQDARREKMNIGDLQGVTGGSHEGDALDSIKALEERRGATVGQMAGHKATGQEYTEKMGANSILIGNNSRSRLQDSISQQLAELGIRQAESQQAAQSQKFSIAQQLASIDAQARQSGQDSEQAVAEFMRQLQRDQASQSAKSSDAMRDVWKQVFKETGSTAAADEYVQQMIGSGLGW